jgi:hypothetical protein
MENLSKAIIDPPLLAVSSDASKGLANVVKVVFTHVEQRECFRYFMKNYVKMFAGAEHMYPAARVYMKVVYEHHKTIPRRNPDVFYWLDEYHSLLWYRSGFNPVIKYDYVTNNIVESFNNWIKDTNDLPVCELADKLREKIMDLFHRRHRIGRMFKGKILPPILRMLKVRTRGLDHLLYVKWDNYIAEVRDNNDFHSKFVVRALNKECQCEE